MLILTVSIPLNVTAEVVRTAPVLVPEIETDSLSVPSPPVRLSPGFRVVPLATKPFVPITPLYVSSPVSPVNDVPVSALVVSGQVMRKKISF